MQQRPHTPLEIDRRRFLAASSTAIGLGFVGLERAVHAAGSRAATTTEAFYGPLQADPAQILDLPKGFTYSVFSTWGQKMDDGLLVPSQHDGMACYPAGEGQCLLVRNHELTTALPPRYGPYGWQNEKIGMIPSERIFDPGTETGTPSLGGTTTVLYDMHNRKVLRQWLSLAGTGHNCSGGATPWGTWLSCEEWTQRADTMHARDHGFVFEVPASTEMRVCEPVPLLAMGRFRHEAVAIDPASGVIYLTEDRDDGLIYRFIPKVPGKLVEGGALQALGIKDIPSFDTRNWTEDGTSNLLVGQDLEIRWIDVDDVESPNDDLRYRAFEQGAARFARGEGIWHGDDSVYWACTTGGHARFGQIFRFFPESDDTPGRLQLFIEPGDGGLVENADNLTIAPNGDIFLCEDGPDSDGLTRITVEGELERFAINRMNNSEFAGACFSPDGETLFVNIQTPGLSLAITGPWLKRT
jgi:hypothetical protein